MKRILILAAMIPVLAMAENTTQLSQHLLGDAESSKKIELGVGVGFPVSLGMVLGYWGGKDFPIVARLALGMGAQVDLGVDLDPEAALKKYVVASSGALGFFGTLPDSHYTAGVSAGLKFKAFFVQGGPAVIYY